MGVPVLFGLEYIGGMIDGIVGDADLLIIDNGSPVMVKSIINQYAGRYKNITVIENDTNVYVNPAWNQIMQYFLKNKKYDQLVIMNSDLFMRGKWAGQLVNGISCIPTDGSHKEDQVVMEGTPGVFIHLNREMVELVYPIPNKLKVWFGDNWIYDRIRKAGFKTVIRSGMLATHHQGGSKTVQQVQGISEIIEQDKLVWEQVKDL